MFVNRLFPLALVSLASARVQFLGVAIAGTEFGCEIDGSCPLGSAQIPLKSFGGGDGEAQMRHFVEDDQMNMFRLPVSWQFLVNNKLGGDLDSGNLAKYDQLMQACLGTGAHCIIDVHNFARWDGGIIGQGGPTDDQFAQLWSQLATKYASSDRVVFGLMNEPHDLDAVRWAESCQAAVTAIRKAGASTQMILLPGSNFDSAGTLTDAQKGGGPALMASVSNPDGGTDGLLLDVHKYLDIDNSGTHAECVTDNVDAFRGVADFLRREGRKGLVSETGASADASCLERFCAQNAFINANSDVLVGLVAWGAGSFDGSYLLSLTPSQQGGKLVDGELANKCILGTWVDGPNATASDPPGTTAAGSPTGTRMRTRTVTMTDMPTGSSVMVVTMTGTATDGEPTTLLTAPGAPDLFPVPPPSSSSSSSHNGALTTVTGTDTSAAPTGTATGNLVGRLQPPGTLASLLFLLVVAVCA